MKNVSLSLLTIGSKTKEIIIFFFFSFVFLFFFPLGICVNLFFEKTFLCPMSF